MSVEVEIKLKINSRTDIERVLEETGFVRADLVLESDTYYTSDHHDFAALDEASCTQYGESNDRQEECSHYIQGGKNG